MQGKIEVFRLTRISTRPNKLMENIHDRMPVILHPSEFSDWLNPDNQAPVYLTYFLRPYPDDGLGERSWSGK